MPYVKPTLEVYDSEALMSIQANATSCGTGTCGAGICSTGVCGSTTYNKN